MRNNRVVRYYVNTFNYLNGIVAYFKYLQKINRKFVILDEKPSLIEKEFSHKPRVVVLIVGETARAQNFSLYGYERQTNPRLSQMKDLVVFHDTSACGTSTYISVPCMFSLLKRKNFNILDAWYTQNLVDIVALADYDVLWVENDDGCKRMCDRVGEFIPNKHYKEPYCVNDYCYDEVMLDILKNQLQNLKQNTLIVLHAMGSHGPSYYKRYPKQFKKFKPICDKSEIQECAREDIVNAYDNTILYTDYIIASVIDMLQNHPQFESAMFYVSDHGESLGENNIYLHALPYKIAPDTQTKVPMFLWLEKDLMKSLKIDEICLKTRAKQESFSHDNIFHSIIRLLSIKTKPYNKDLDIFLPCLKE